MKFTLFHCSITKVPDFVNVLTYIILINKKNKQSHFKLRAFGSFLILFKLGDKIVNHCVDTPIKFSYLNIIPGEGEEQKTFL